MQRSPSDNEKIQLKQQCPPKKFYGRLHLKYVPVCVSNNKFPVAFQGWRHCRNFLSQPAKSYSICFNLCFRPDQPAFSSNALLQPHLPHCYFSHKPSSHTCTKYTHQGICPSFCLEDSCIRHLHGWLSYLIQVSAQMSTPQPGPVWLS